MDLEIVRLERDEWDMGRDVGRAIEAPTLDDVQAAIKALDQERHTLLRLVLRDGAYMVVGGGREDFIVYVVVSDQRAVNLNTECFTFWSDPPVMVVAGGQAGDYETRYVVTLDEVFDAALGFAVVGGLNSRYSWTQR